MTWFALSLFVFLIQLNIVQGARYDIDDTEGIIVIVLLALAGIVCIFAAILFAIILYKLWNGSFGRHRLKSDSNEYIASNSHRMDEADGSRYSTFTTDPVVGSVNQTVTEEVVQQEEEPEVVEKGVELTELKDEEVIVTQAPSTSQAEMETQELVIVFDNNEEVVDVFTHIN